jgi:hypothetical protein
MQKRPARKTRRADGKVFWGMKSKKEIWITEEQFEKWDSTQKEYARKRAKQWQDKLPKEKRFKRGFLDEKTGLYFYEYSGIGKPVWVTKEEFDRRKEKARIGRLAYYYRLKNLPLPTYAPGDRHPEDPNLVVVRLYANRICWGTEELYKKQLESRSKSYKKYRENKGLFRKESAKQKKQKIFEFYKQNPNLKRSRGDKDFILNRIFWGYSTWGTEIWLSPEKFDQKIKHDKYRRDLLRKLKKNEQHQQGTNKSS